MLAHKTPKFSSYRNQSIDLQSKSELIYSSAKDLDSEHGSMLLEPISSQ